MQELAGLAHEFGKKMIGDTYDVMGQSFGSWVAVWYGIMHADPVQQLILECPAGFRAADVTDPFRMKWLGRSERQRQAGFPFVACQWKRRGAHGGIPCAERSWVISFWSVFEAVAQAAQTDIAPISGILTKAERAFKPTDGWDHPGSCAPRNACVF